MDLELPQPPLQRYWHTQAVSNQAHSMKHQAVVATFCALLLALPGCQKDTTSSSVSVGPFNVNSDTGMASGQAFGIDLKAAGASGAEIKFELHGNPQYSSRAEITLADDLNIKLETMNEGDAVAFQLNGKKYGTLAQGDEVAIDEERNVTVNGEERATN